MSNIPRKLKPCKTCGDPCYVFSHGDCKDCSQKRYASEKAKRTTLTQTENGKEAKYFKVERKPIKKVSDKQAKLNRAYMVLRNAYLKNHPVCEIRWICKGSPATEVHHVKPRAFFLLDETVFKAVCRACHDHINTHDAEARELGYLQSKHS